MNNRIDVSLFILIILNLLFGFQFITLGGEVGTLLWVYWFQSIAIGVTNFLRILTQKNFSVGGFFINGKPAEKTNTAKRKTALFFLIHYGAFHLGYLLFLRQITTVSLDQGFFIGIGIFAINHLLSFILNYRKETLVEKNIGTLMVYPYIRILPMHIIILFGGSYILKNSSLNLLILFILLKISADVLMHIVEHKMLQNEYKVKLA